MWILYALMAAILWGFNYSLSEKILNSISPISLLAFEMAAGAIVFSTLSYFTTLRKDLQSLVSVPNLLLLTVLEVVVVMVASFCIVISIREKNATAAGIIELIYPLFTVFFTWFLFHENHVTPATVVGGLLIFFGVLIIAR